jgi:hypothetical protein
MIRKRTLDTFDRWAEQARSSLVAIFANGILKDKAAVIAAITRAWSNGARLLRVGPPPDVGCSVDDDVVYPLGLGEHRHMT